MVLFKRKPFALIPTPANIPDNAEVYIMRGTNEVFVEYEKYLKRLDFLMQKKFVDSVNGKSGLNFFDALQSETSSTMAIESIFPEVLRDPILRKVQFATISRIDDLGNVIQHRCVPSNLWLTVNSVFEEFKRDFFPGEDVIVLLEDGQAEGSVREKAKFPMIKGPKGEVQREPFSRYFVRLHGPEEKDAVVDDHHVRRDRRVFTKQNLRAFLKHSLQREAWVGAPWLVKEHLAVHYRLPMEIPSHLLEGAKLLLDKGSHDIPILPLWSFADETPEEHMLSQRGPRKRTKNFTQDDHLRQQARELEQVRATQQVWDTPSPYQYPNNPYLPGFQRAGAHPQANLPNQNQYAAAPQSRVVIPPPIRYPIEDLDIAPKRNGVVRPQLEFFTEKQAAFIKGGRKSHVSGISLESMGMLLEVWNTLNVQCEVYVLDSFTFDDFVDAMLYHSMDSCELLDETHCAVLKLLVNEKKELQVQKGMLPTPAAESEPTSSDEQNDESEMSTPLPDAPARSTRSRLSYVDPHNEHPRSPGPAMPIHRAKEMLGDRDWITRLGDRDFKNGGWQVILVGVLHQLSLSPVFKTRADKVLAWLADMDSEASQESALLQFACMDVNLRISALQMITQLSVSTPAIKDFLDACSEDMTDVRKRKIEHQRLRKAAVEELHIKDRERKILLPDNMLPDSPPKQSSVEAPSTNGDVDDSIEVHDAGSSASEDVPMGGRSLRRGNDRKRKREEEAARVAEEKKKAELAKQQPKQSKEFKKLLVDIEELNRTIKEHEAYIDECDNDLREANVQRTRCLGKDRFCNRYYWFERNGQPYGGLPRSSTASYGYANGRVWVQGPDELDKPGLIDLSPEDEAKYQQEFNCTVPERRVLEEGKTVLMSSYEWGYYDDPVLLDNLIGWLDDRGEREKKLRKELQDWQITIGKYMAAHKKFKDEEAAKKIESEEEHATRITTRHKTHEDRTAARERCLKWTNTMAIDELGHLHSQPDKPKPKPKPALTNQQKVALRSGQQPKGVAVPVNRHGKPVTRQGY